MSTASGPSSAIGFDQSPALQDFSHHQKLVTNDWLGAHLGRPGLKVVESDEDSILYNIGHIPTAVRIDWATDLGDPVTRDFLSAEAFAALMDAKGISRDDTVVIYGDRSNLWATYTLWVFELFGHPDVRLLDGGRDAWIQEDKEISYDASITPTTGYPVVERDDATHRIFVDELRSYVSGSFSDANPGIQIFDLRDPDEYAGQIEQPDTPRSSGLPEQQSNPKATPVFSSRQGHIPTAINFSTKSLLLPNSRFPRRRVLEKLFDDYSPTTPTVVYCGTGAKAAVAWIVLHYLLGWTSVRLYDGSWGEWGNMIRMPIVQGHNEGYTQKQGTGDSTGNAT